MIRLQILKFIQQKTAQGDPPSFEEIAQHIGRFRSVAYYHVGLLQEAGLVTRKNKRARSIRVTKKGVLSIALSMIQPGHRQMELERICPACGGDLTETNQAWFNCAGCGPIRRESFYHLERVRRGQFEL